MAKTMLTIGKTLPCRSCKKTQPHHYDGEQHFSHNGDRYHLWTCCTCGNTRTERILDAAAFCEDEQAMAEMGTGRF